MKTETKTDPAPRTHAAIDKSGWGPGPWQKEPDHVAFEVLGFPCIIHRVETHGGLCGYLAVPPGHPWHGEDYGDIGAEVHGGLTYSSKCDGTICHVPKHGESDDVWWLGFDCAHYNDLSPALAARISGYIVRGGEYRTIGFVRDELDSLAQQASQVTT